MSPLEKGDLQSWEWEFYCIYVYMYVNYTISFNEKLTKTHHQLKPVID